MVEFNSIAAGIDAADQMVKTAQVDPLFQPPCCTFVPTRHEENVPNINSLPGKDVFYIDCRILPGISHDDVLASAREIGYPLFVKPVRSGSSFGVTRVEREAALLPAGDATETISVPAAPALPIPAPKTRRKPGIRQ